MKLPVRATFTAIAAAVVLSGCAPDVLVILDPILSATADSDGHLSRELRRSARAQSARALVVSLEELTAAALAHALETHTAPTVLLPALVGRMALQAAADFPERRFYMIGRDTAAPAPNVAAVRFERGAAFEAAARTAVDFLAADRNSGSSAGCALLFLADSPQRAGMIHAFFAEREAAKLPDVTKDTPRREIKSVGIIGAGTMGGGIAMNFVNVGIPVKLLEVKQDALDKGLAVIRRNYENTAKKGRISKDDVEKRMGLIEGTLSYDDFAGVDLVIEAVFESMDIKKQVFTKLDEVCKPGAILATNTSTLDVNEIASVTKRPEDVVGMHFFSPANVMKLLENVRGEKTSPEVIATVMDLSKRIKKVGVCVGVCHGFVGNRMLHQRQSQAMALVDDGATPWQVDKVIYDFGFPMGPFAMSDLAGLDVGYRIREERRKAGDPKAQELTWTDKLVEQGRHGQKTGAGVYLYEEGNRKGKPDPEVEALIEQHRKEKGITPREISDQEILERNLYIMINEGAKILEEGIALRSSDIDVIYLYGYGFPAYRGGPMFYADQVGVKTVYDKVVEFQERFGDDWKPAPLLERLAREGGKFGDL